MSKCDKTYCMKNLNGACVHNVCPILNEFYRTPLEVAMQIEKEVKSGVRIMPHDLSATTYDERYQKRKSLGLSNGR